MFKQPIIRTIYLYLFSLVGLVMMIVGAVNFIDMGLKAYVFTTAEEQDRLNQTQPPYAENFIKALPTTIDPGVETITVKITADEYNQMQYMVNDYKDWKTRRSQVDPIRAERERRASMNIALIAVGLPLYLYHWYVIKRDHKETLKRA